MENTATEAFKFKDIFRQEHRSSLFITIVLLIAAYLSEHFANLYALEYSTRATTTHVGDLLLDNLPVVNLNILIVEGALIGLVLGGIFLYFRPRYVLFALKAFALLIITRAFFTSLTHIGIYPKAIHPGVGIFDGIYEYLNLETGFFFSGHTSIPFLMGLVFWEERYARWVFLSLSVIFGTGVLLAHVHYSIDVFAAPFMAYGVFSITKKVFKKDFELLPKQDVA